MQAATGKNEKDRRKAALCYATRLFLMKNANKSLVFRIEKVDTVREDMV